MLPDPATSIIHIPGGLVIAPDGGLFISFMAHDVPVVDPVAIKNHIWVLRSNDGGRTFADPVSAVPGVVYGNRGDELKMLKSLAGARLALDTAQTSRYRGRLYVSFLTVLEGRLQVMVTSSSDTGRTWRSPVRVNDDAGSANHSNPQITVGDRGDVVVIWNDRRADPNDLCFRATVSASVDGGETFLPNVPLTQTASCPLGRDPKTVAGLAGFAGRFMQGGETQGLAAVPGGKFLAVFVGSGHGTMELHCATIEVRR